jgi:AAA15 family ATPase/GTPase
MKIKSLEFQNHPLFGNLSLNFCDPHGKPYDFIVIAGENGTGKTQLLEIIFAFRESQNKFVVSNPNSIFAKFAMCEFERTALIEQKSQRVSNNHVFLFDYFIFNSNNIILQLKPNDDGHHQTFIPKGFANGEHEIFFSYTKLLQWFLYSPVDSNFSINTISSVTNKILDKKEEHETRQTQSIGQEMNQLFVDITNQDSSELSQWVGKNRERLVPEDVISPRIKRFRAAFQKILPNKEFLGSHNTNGLFQAIFEFGEHKIPLENLSHGEKQIILRSGFILRNQNAAKGSIILIDEIEMGLHPALQEKMLGYYGDLVKFNDYQNQVIVTTHSPFTVHNQMKNLKVIVLKNQAGKVIVDENPTFAQLAPREIVQRAFDVPLPTRPTVITEGKTDAKILTIAWSKLFSDKQRPFEIRESGIGINSGNSTGTRMAIERISEFVPDFPVIGLLDHDESGVKEYNGLTEKHGFQVSQEINGLKSHQSAQGYLLLLPIIESRDQFVNSQQSDCYLTIEHYFSDDVLNTHGLKDDYRIKNTGIFSIKDSRKVHFAENIVQTLDAKEFENFRQLFETIAKILKVQI